MSATSQNEINVSNVATMAVDNLMELADTVMSERRFAIWNHATEDESERLLDLHDRLVTMAREMSDFFEEEPEATEYTEEDVVTGKILNGMVENGWDLNDLADAAGVRKETLDRILSGATARPQARTLRKIEKALGYEEGFLDE